MYQMFVFDLYVLLPRLYALRKFTILTIILSMQWPPFVGKTIVNGKLRYSGFCMEVLQALAHSLNFTQVTF